MLLWRTIALSKYAACRSEPGEEDPESSIAALFAALARLSDDGLLAVAAWAQAETCQRTAARGGTAAPLAWVQSLLTDAVTAASPDVRLYLLGVAHQLLAEHIAETRRDLA